MEGKENSNTTRPRPPPWLGPTKTEASTLLWKLKDCFSNSAAAPSANTDTQGLYMDGRKPIPDLKDVPPPPAPLHNNTPPLAAQRFPHTPFPMPPSSSLPSLPQLLQVPQQLPQPPLSQQQEGSSPKVSMCSYCDYCSGYNTVSGGNDLAVSSSMEDALSFYMTATSLGASSANSNASRTSSVQYKLNQSCENKKEAFASLTSHGYTPYLPSSVATSQPVSSHPYASCSSGLLHSFPSSLLSSTQSNQISSSAPPTSSLPSVCAPLHGSCLASGFYPCSVDCSSWARTAQRSTSLGEHSPTVLPTSTTSSPLCPNPLHPNVEHTVSVNRAHYCQECFLKPRVVPDSNKIFPNFPQTVPVYNGCSTSAEAALLVASNQLSKIGLTYGSPERCAPENIPPVGVFWDIENCSVPSGRSAAAVVNRLRSRFFQGHREAEFICVCDINKESKSVVEELNNCQVTVAHINATAKNAADDKLRQSLRRFAETHSAPAKVVLVSSDVNFASELSDLRHRHGFQVILVHGNHVSPALLQHANCHIPFHEITADLPPRMVNAQPNFSLLYVHNLPITSDKNQLCAVRLRLRRLSSNCGGKVLGVSHGTAVLRFSNAAAAARARKRMENENVYGHQISVSFSPRPTEGFRPEPKFPSYPHHVLQALPQPFPIRPQWLLPAPPFSSVPFLPLDKTRSPRRPRRATRPVPERPYSPRRGCSEPPHGAPFKAQEVNHVEPKPCLDKERAISSSPQRSDLESPDHVSKSSLSDESGFRRDGSSSQSTTGSPVEEKKVMGEFQISTPSAFSNLHLQGSFSPLVLSQASWSSRSASPCLSSRSSPLLAPPRSPYPETSEPFSNGAGVQVGNLDYRMSRKDLQQMLHDTFSRYGQVKSLELSPHTDYQLKAIVHMALLQNAISAVSGLHRYKIGGKRIQVSLVTGSSTKSLAMFSTEIISILQDAPANCLPLFKFTEIFEKKYSRKLVVGDLYRLPEVVAVREQGGSRLVCLLHNSQIRQSPLGSSQSHEGSSTSGSPVVFEELEYHEPICRLHYTQQNFSEADFDPDAYNIPFVAISVSALAPEVHTLLQSHEGTLPLLSFPDCYAAKFSPLQLGDEKLEGAVPLEHVITCVPSVTVVTSQNGFKVIKWIHNKPPAPNSEPWIQRCKSPVGNPQLIQFSREIIDLLKCQPSCIMPIGKFIPSYHHHFAKQCRVSDYGFSKLLELLEAVPHVLQILGMGTKRMLTLTHRAQVKRFTQDLLKLLKFQASKQVAIKDFMQAYHWCFSRDWQVIDYGVCDLMDLLKEIPDTTITTTQQEADIVISVPKRERTSEEMDRTKQFGKEVVDLLRHQPHCRMLFSKFIPTYHHHFGRQCKLSYYGFTKLMELFEAIPEVLMVLECAEEKVLTLTELERIKALAAQLVKLLRAQKTSSLPVNQLLTEYSKTFGYGLRLQDFDASSLPALLSKLCHVVKVVDGAEGREVQLINRKSLRLLTSQVLALLMSQEEEQVSSGLRVDQLSSLYSSVYGLSLNPCEYGFLSLSELLKSLPYLVELFYEESEDSDSVREEKVKLTRLYQFARNVRALLHTYHYNQIFLTEFPGAYLKFTGCSLDPRLFGFNNIDELLSAIPQVVWIKGHTHKKIIVLKNDMKARTSSSLSNSPQPSDVTDQSPRESPVSCANSESPAPDCVVAPESELLCMTSPVDLLCGPVPSCLPSPQLHPDPVLQSDLMRFEKKTPATGDSAADGPEEPHSAEVLPQPPSKTANSPRRAARSKFKLAANFSFTADV